MQLAPVLVLGLLWGSGGLLGESTDDPSGVGDADLLGRQSILSSLDEPGYRTQPMNVQLQILGDDKVQVRLPDATDLDLDELGVCAEVAGSASATCLDKHLLINDPAVVQALLGANDPTLQLLCPDLLTKPCEVPLWLLMQDPEEDPLAPDYNPYATAPARAVVPAPEPPLMTPENAAPMLAAAAAPAAVAAAAVLVPWQTLAATAPARRIPLWLRYAGAAALFSRIKDDQLLENETRAKVSDYVHENPGASIQEVQEAVDVAWGTAVYHLARLERHGQMVSSRDGNHRRYWVAGSREAMRRDALALLRTETARRLAEAVHANPGIKQKELCEQIGIRNPVASKYLKRLAEERLVRNEPEGRFRCYYPTVHMPKVLGMADCSDDAAEHAQILGTPHNRAYDLARDSRSSEDPAAA